MTVRTGSLKMVAAMLCSMVLGSALTATAFARQGNMINARDSLKTAISYLQAATPDKGGHRDQAIQLCRQAIQQVNAGIQYANMYH